MTANANAGVTLDQTGPSLGINQPSCEVLPVPPVLESPPLTPSRGGSVLDDISDVFGDVRHGAHTRALLLLVGGLIAILVANMVGQVFLNVWQGVFFSAIGRKDEGMIFKELGVFAGLVLVLLVLIVVQTFSAEILKLRLRQGLTAGLLDKWLLRGKSYRLNISATEEVNPDQRIQEDVRNVSEMSVDLGTGFLSAALLLISFIGVLWELSAGIQFAIRGISLSIPGYMVWVALIYAAIGSGLTWFVGKPLIDLNAERYAREADLRFSLMRVNESSEAIALWGGEKDERRIIDSALQAVTTMMKKLSYGHAKLTWITSGYGWFAIAVPVVVALPGYMQGALDLGGLMMVIGAFGQVQQSLRWFVDNFAKIADWRAGVRRVGEFKRAIDIVDDFEDVTQIRLEPHGMGHLAFKNVSVVMADGAEIISEATAYITPGERVLITGESGSGKSTLFRAIAGLWPWGTGTVYVPARDKTMFMPQKPYLPLGTLEGAISYPKGPGYFSRPDIIAALERVNLSELTPMLDRKERWDKLLSLGQQQRLAFARVLLHRPEWVFLDEATAALDDANQDLVMSIFQNELSNASILSIGHRPGLEAYHTRTLQLVPSTGGGAKLRRKPPKTKQQGWFRHVLQHILQGEFRARGPVKTPDGTV